MVTSKGAAQGSPDPLVCHSDKYGVGLQPLPAFGLLGIAQAKASLRCEPQRTCRQDKLGAPPLV